MSKEEEYKITVTLSKKGLTTLDLIKETSGFGSRGRVIEEAILSIWDLVKISETFLKAYVDMSESGKTLDAFILFPYIVSMQTKLSRFGSASSIKKT